MVKVIKALFNVGLVIVGGLSFIFWALVLVAYFRAGCPF